MLKFKLRNARDNTILQMNYYPNGEVYHFIHKYENGDLISDLVTDLNGYETIKTLLSLIGHKSEYPYIRKIKGYHVTILNEVCDRAEFEEPYEITISSFTDEPNIVYFYYYKTRAVNILGNWCEEDYPLFIDGLEMDSKLV